MIVFAAVCRVKTMGRSFTFFRLLRKNPRRGSGGDHSVSVFLCDGVREGEDDRLSFALQLSVLHGDGPAVDEVLILPIRGRDLDRGAFGLQAEDADLLFRLVLPQQDGDVVFIVRPGAWVPAVWWVRSVCMQDG